VRVLSLTLVAFLCALTLAPAADAQERWPGRATVQELKSYLATRDARVSFSLRDTRGHVHGLDADAVYSSASVVKATLLVAYLRTIAPREPTTAERRLLRPMIVHSSNRAATAIFARLGTLPLLALAQRAGMRHFAVAGFWSSAQSSAADQEGFFTRQDRFVPRASRPYVRRLLSSVVRAQRWGFSRYAEAAGFESFFKGGWRRTPTGYLVHEVARFERDDERVTLAVLSDGNPSYGYGAATLRGVAQRLFGPARLRRPFPVPSFVTPVSEGGGPRHRRAGLVDVRHYAPAISVDVRYAGSRNLTGKPLPGYCQEWALLLDPLARDLARVQRRLQRGGHGLLVLDAYRPRRATRALVRWANESGRADLVGTYIAARSRHNQGIAVDLTLKRLRDARQLRMGSSYDDLSPRAHTYAARGRALRNRLELRAAMERFGFAPYDREWWHFEHRTASGPALDLPLGCG
jgi:zinc D-Ala-D-Ala dipeptidase